MYVHLLHLQTKVGKQKGGKQKTNSESFKRWTTDKNELTQGSSKASDTQSE